jgi:hypothetical protein
MTHYESIKTELTSHVTDMINEGSINADNYQEAHYHAFNEDYYIIGYYQAEQWLKKHGLDSFEAIAICQDYERDNFGEVSDKYDNAESVVNMLAYVFGEDILPCPDSFRELVEYFELDDSLWANYRVTYSVDSLDPNPEIEYFEEEYEAIEYVGEELSRRVQHIVEHSVYTVTDSDLADIEANESTLVRIERI